MAEYHTAGITLTAVPAQHWSMRTFWNRNRSLWCGWVFEGDTAVSGLAAIRATPELLLIPRTIGQNRPAALPIGLCQDGSWRYTHMDPQSAVALWQQLGSPLAFPIHWGVFELADESLDEPVRELTDALVN